MKRKIQVLCVLGGLLLFLLAEWMARMDETEKQGYFLRNSYGQGESKYEIEVLGLEEESSLLTLELVERQYSQEEVALVFEQIMEHMEPRILNQNTSLLEVRTDLDLPTWLAEEGVKIRWTSSEPLLLDSFGQIGVEEISKDGVEVYLDVHLSTGRFNSQYQISVILYPPLLSEQEVSRAGFMETIRQLDEEHSMEVGLQLPQEYEGKQLRYRDASRADYKILLVLGVVSAFLYGAREQMKEDQKKKKRQQELVLDYAEIVFKLKVFIGAGMTVSAAWEKLVLDYEKRLKLGKGKPRAVYEEMYQTSHQIRCGLPEGQAYMEFGKRCQLQPYLKLSSLLEQNRKTGTKNLSSLLEAEMADAWEQRKNLAKRMGEEAGTKLVVPLFLMLGIVMVIIMVPAMLSMT